MERSGIIPQAAVFDLDNTLYPESDYFKAIFQEFSIEQHVPFEHFDFLFSDFDAIRFTKKDIFSFVLEKLNLDTAKFQPLLFEKYIRINTVLHPYPNANTLFQSLQEKNIPIYILTNGVIEAQKNKWEMLKIPKDNTTLQPAREFGVEKPHLECFQAFLEKYQLQNTPIWWLGDREENDLSFGKQRGDHTTLIGSFSDAISHFTSIFV